MTSEQETAQAKATALHDEEEREKAIAARLPKGDEQDEHYMRGERLSDEAWAIEEANDLEPRPSGLWSRMAAD